MAQGKHKSDLRINAEPAVTTGGTLVSSTDDFAPPAPPTITAPDGLVLTTSIDYSSVAPTATIAATWNKPTGVDPQSYRIQFDESSAFPVATTRTYPTPGTQPSAAASGFKPATVYYGRVAAVYVGRQSDWSATASVTTDSDTVPPAAPTSPTAAFINAGDLVITWVNPTSANFRYVEIGIYTDSSKTTQLALFNDATGRRVWTAAENLAATSQLGDPTVYVEMRARSWSNVYSLTSVNASATKARPATPTSLTTTWAGDTGTAGAACLITWAAATDAASWVVTVDGVSRPAPSPFLYYPLDMNRSDHAGTPDPVLSITVAAYDALKQANVTSATTTATNAAPLAPAVTLTDAFGFILARVTSTPPADFLIFEYVFRLSGIAQLTQESASSEQQYEAPTNGSWSVTVRVRDVFGQYSTGTTSAAVAHDGLTIDILRALATYTDDLGSSAVALGSLKDGNTVSGGITYPA